MEFEVLEAVEALHEKIGKELRLTFVPLRLAVGPTRLAQMRSYLAERKIWLQREKVERQRIAVAFGTERPHGYLAAGAWAGCGKVEQHQIHWFFADEDNWQLAGVHIYAEKACNDTNICYDFERREYKIWCVGTTTGEIMARGLYRFGVEDEPLLSQLPPLSAHEKLELRLSMPREFWPKAWLDEEGE